MKALDLLRPQPQSVFTSTGLLLLRVFAGYAMMVHGWPKMHAPFSWMGPNSGTPGFFQGLAAISEWGGGLAWILGLLTPVASFGMACTMAVAAWTHLVKLGHPLITRDANGSAELPALFLFVALLLLLAGPGRWSLDALLFRKKT